MRSAIRSFGIKNVITTATRLPEVKQWNGSPSIQGWMLEDAILSQLHVLARTCQQKLTTQWK